MKNCSPALRLALALGSLAWSARAANEAQIESLTHDGSLTWSGPATRGAYRVEWAPTVNGPWSASWASLTNVPATGAGATVAVPMFYRVVYTSPPALLVNVDAAGALSRITNHVADTNFVVLDVRTPAEYASRHVKGAVNLNFYAPDFAARLAMLDRQKTCLVYCASGSRSGQAAAQMHALEFAEVYNLSGGFGPLAALPASAAWLEP